MSDLRPSPYSRDYEITDAMFGAFRSPGGMPFFWKLFAWGTGLFSVFGFLLFPPAIVSYVDLIRTSVEIETSPEDLGNLGVSFGRFALIWTAYLLGYVVIVALIRAAFFRGYFFGETEDQIPIQFGRDEVRQGLAILGFIGLIIAASAAAILVLVIFVSLMLVAFGENGALPMVLSIIVFYIAFLAMIIWVGVRFYCAGALTGLREKTHVWAARYVSLNRFWPIFGSILVAGIIGYVVNYVASGFALLMAFSGLAGSDLLTILAGQDPEAMIDAIDRATETASFRFATIIAIVLASAGYSFYTIILAGPQAFFTDQWIEALEGEEEEPF